MSNKILALLVLILFFIFAYFLYAYFFIYYNATIHFSSNVDNYSVKLYVPKIAKSFTYECSKKECDIQDIAPFEYNMTLSKKWYENDFRVITIKKSSKNDVSVSFRKIVSLEEVEKEKKKELTKDDKVNLVKLKASSYAFFNLEEKGVYYFTESSNAEIILNYFSQSWVKSENKASFKKISPEAISLQAVVGESDSIFIENGEEKYIFSPELNILKKIDLKWVQVSYLKPWDKDEYLIVTNIWTYVYSFFDEKLTYFPLFFDFVAGEKKLIGYIKQDDNSRLKNFWISWETQNIILEFDRQSLDKKILLKTDEDITKIYLKKWVISVEDKSGKNFILNGVEGGE